MERLHFSIFLDLIWTWTLHLKNLLVCGWSWTEFKKIRTGSGSQNITVCSSLLYIKPRDIYKHRVCRYPWIHYDNVITFQRIMHCWSFSGKQGLLSTLVFVGAHRWMEFNVFDSASTLTPKRFVPHPLVTGKGCLHSRIVPQEHWLINDDYPRRARNYNEENQTHPFRSTRSVNIKKCCIHSWFY